MREYGPGAWDLMKIGPRSVATPDNLSCKDKIDPKKANLPEKLANTAIEIPPLNVWPK